MSTEIAHCNVHTKDTHKQAKTETVQERNTGRSMLIATVTIALPVI